MQRDEEATVTGENVVPITRARKPAKFRGGERTELEVAEMFVQCFGDDFRYCAQLGGYFHWADTHWQQDVREYARECAKDIARKLAAEAAALMDADTFSSAKRAGSARGVSAILDLARSDPRVVFAPEDADRDPWALNFTNGTLDLQTFELRPHRKSDLITRVCRGPYDPDATAPTFERFLAEVQPNPEVRKFLARLCGYAALGIVLEHVLGVLCGTGANGKSVFADTITHALGGYARPGPSTLVIGNGYQPHPTDVASLVGSRLVVLHETARGAAFDASKVKLLTGGDRLTARHMREDFFEFAPSHTLLMLSNYRPTADATDAALWRRVRLVPFDVVIPVERRNPLLTEAIRAEVPGVLRWIVDGAREWQRMGLAPPACVLEQTERYRASEDVIGQFLDEHTVRLPQASVKAGALYAAFKKWCETSGQRAVNGNEFAAEMVARGFEKVKRASGYLYLGLGLQAEAADAS